MLTKAKLRDYLTKKLEENKVDDADEIADSIVDQADEDGLFEIDEQDDE